MIFVYPFLELTGVNKNLSIELWKTATVFQLIWKKHISYLFLNPSWKLFKKILIDFKLWYFDQLSILRFWLFFNLFINIFYFILFHFIIIIIIIILSIKVINWIN